MALPALAVDTAALIGSVMSPDCLAYRVVGICYWLECTPFGCHTRTSVKVAHYVPDAVVSSYSETGHNPWTEVRGFSAPTGASRGGGNGTSNQEHENNLAAFKNADAIGHPGGLVFGRWARAFGTICTGAGTSYQPYFLSTLDVIMWRYGIPEAVYPESLTPGRREIGSRKADNLWGNVYPREGFLHQSDDAKAAAVVTERVGDIVTRRGQVHIYQALLAQPEDGYWPAGALKENDASTGKWQPLAPKLSTTCSTFPTPKAPGQAADGGYAWALWRPYQCCKREGQTFLGSIDIAQ